MKVEVAVKGFMPSSFELTAAEERMLSRNSIERVANLAIEVAEVSDHQDWQTVVDDLKELKQIMCRCWYSAQQAVFAASNDMRE